MKVLTSAEFPEAIKSGVVMVDFFADWCGPCKMMGPVVEKLAEQAGDKASFYKVNVDNSQDIAQQFGIMSIPTIVIFKDGVKQVQDAGYRPLPELTKMLEKVLG